MVGQDPVHEPPLPIGDIGQQQVLLGGEADAAADGLDHAPQRAPEPAVRAVPDAAVLDEHAQEGAPVALLVPPEMVLDIRNLDRCGRREGAAELPLHLIAEPVQALLVDEILEPRVAPVAAVAVIALNLNDRLPNLHNLPRPDESQRVREPRVGVRLAVRTPHAAAHQHVEPCESVSSCNDQEAQVVRVHIAAVVVREG